MSQEVDWHWDSFNFSNKSTNWFMQRVRETFASHVPEGSKILEIGCGTGHILTYIAKDRKADAYGIDISPNAEKVIHQFEQKNDAHVNFRVGDGFAVPYPENTFDVVYSEGVIEHFTEAQTQKMVEEHVRVCKKDGLVIISVPNEYNVFLTLSKKILGKKYPHYPERSYTIHQLIELVERAGTKVVAVDGFAWQQGFAHLRFVKKLIPLLKHLPDRMLPPRLRSIIGHECMVVAKKQ